MATIAAAAPTAGKPASARTPYILEKVVDFAVIAAAVTIGKSRQLILFSEIFPNVAPLMLVLFALEMGIAITPIGLEAV